MLLKRHKKINWALISTTVLKIYARVRKPVAVEELSLAVLFLLKKYVFRVLSTGKYWVSFIHSFQEIQLHRFSGNKLSEHHLLVKMSGQQKRDVEKDFLLLKERKETLLHNSDFSMVHSQAS